MNWQKGVRVTKKGTVWVIGASSGLGLHTAQAFAESGWLVIAGARSFEEAQSSFEMKASENPIRLSLDVTSEESCDRFQREALRISPRVDVLVCGAAVLVLGSCELTDAGEYERVMQTNFVGTVRMVGRVLPLMRRNSGGKIILFPPLTGFSGCPFKARIRQASMRWRATPSVLLWKQNLSASRYALWSRATTGAAATARACAP